MDPHQFEAVAAIREIQNFYGTCDSIDKRKIFRKSTSRLQSKVSREKLVVEQKTVEARCHEPVAEFSGTV